MKILTLSSGGINWTWYIVGVLSDGQFTVLAYDRLHNERDAHPAPDEVGSFIESKGEGDRRVIAVRIGEEVYPVANPRQIFSYQKLRD